MSETFLSLKAAAEMLGVHPVTLRRWAESGKIETVRTAGGHRRFSEDEIARLMQKPDLPESISISEKLRERALSVTRKDLETHHAGWNSSIEIKDREEKRLLGRRLMGLLMQYVAAEEEGSDVGVHDAAADRLALAVAVTAGPEGSAGYRGQGLVVVIIKYCDWIERTKSDKARNTVVINLPFLKRMRVLWLRRMPCFMGKPCLSLPPVMRKT